MEKFSCIPAYAVRYLQYIQNIKSLSPRTVDQYYLDLRLFFRYLAVNKFNVVEAFDTIDASFIEASFIENLKLDDFYAYFSFTMDNRSNATKARQRKVSSLRSFYKYLCRQAVINNNPTLYLEAPKSKNTLPVYLSLEDSVSLLDSIDGKNKERNFAMITLFLNCGLRLSELVGLNLTSIGPNGTLRVIGKGNKERVLYLNESCISALQAYVNVRGTLQIKHGQENALFISRNGNRISNRMVQTVVEKFLLKSGLDTTVYSTHKLRHTAATLMYQNGVDVRVLQEVLGHSNLGTTQIYTHLGQSQVEDAIRENPINAAEIKKKK